MKGSLSIFQAYRSRIISSEQQDDIQRWSRMWIMRRDLRNLVVVKP